MVDPRDNLIKKKPPRRYGMVWSVRGTIRTKFYKCGGIDEGFMKERYNGLSK